MPNQPDNSGRERRRAASRAEAVRNAVDQAFQTGASQGAAAAEQGRERAADLIDQLAQAVGRVREVFDELRPPTPDELRRLRERVAALEERVAALEAASAAKGKRTTTRKTAATRGSSGRGGASKGA